MSTGGVNTIQLMHPKLKYRPKCTEKETNLLGKEEYITVKYGRMLNRIKKGKEFYRSSIIQDMVVYEIITM